jgi:hypothetical protein
MGVEVAEAIGLEAPRPVVAVLGSFAAVLAASVAVRHLSFIRRGPVIADYHRGEGLLCDARESAAIRAAAQLRGTLGGAGHLYPRRLVISAAAWAAAALQAVLLVLPEHDAGRFLPVVLLGVTTAAFARFPAIAFYYRETAGDCVVAYPARICARILDAARLGPAPQPIDLAQYESIGEPAGAPQVAGAQSPARRDEPPA